MNPYLVFGIFAFIFTVILFVVEFIKIKNINGSKVLSVILFITYFCSIFYSCAIDKHNIDKGTLFNPNTTVFMIILRTLTTVGVAAAIMSPFYPNRYLKRICQIILPVIAILNVINLDNNLIAIFGKNFDYFSNYRAYAYVATIAGLLVSGLYNLYMYIIKQEFKEILNSKEFIKTVIFTFVILILLCVLFMQQGALYTLFGAATEKTKDFNWSHRIWLIICILSLILPYLFLRRKSIEDRKLFFGLVALAGLFQYFYLLRTGLSGLPLHLCNAAVVLLFIAYVFKLKGIFYFSYFVNVLGAIFAIIMPNTETHAFTVNTLHFWYNHVIAFALPILGVALGVYERPNLKMMLRAIGFFTLYFLTTVILNAWFNSPQMDGIRGVEVDYFFTYSDFFIDKLEAARPLKYDFPLIINVNGYNWNFFPVYQLTIYGVFIALMFVIWVIYDYLYQVSDRHYELRLAKKLHLQEMLLFKKLHLTGSLSEPINKGAVGMIKIENFTKLYAGAKKPSVEDFNLEIHDGEVFGFIGHNGSGKSTTIKSMVGIQSLTSGSIVIDGYDISKQPLEAKLRIGYVSDNHAVYEKLTGREYVNYVADLYLVSQADRDERISKYVKMFNLEEAFDREIKGYSHGMKQKLVVIASLIHNPKVWILDEPLTGLDPTSAFQIKECMREHANKGNIVFFSSHVIEVVEKICDRICIIQRGKLVGIYEIAKLPEMGLSLEELYMTHVAQANYNTDAPDATGEFNKRKNS